MHKLTIKKLHQQIKKQRITDDLPFNFPIVRTSEALLAEFTAIGN